MGEFSLSHILILSVILLVFFGPSRLPALGQSLGKAIRGFKDGLSEVSSDEKNAPPTQLNQNQQGTQQAQSQKEKQEKKEK